ncbi:MAG TPA: hypothetical protein VGP73_26815 [Thermoanaerobaculia bacterium]
MEREGWESEGQRTGDANRCLFPRQPPDLLAVLVQHLELGSVVLIDPDHDPVLAVAVLEDQRRVVAIDAELRPD